MSFSLKNPHAAPGSPSVSPRPVQLSKSRDFLSTRVCDRNRRPLRTGSGCVGVRACHPALPSCRVGSGGCPPIGHTTPRGGSRLLSRPTNERDAVRRRVRLRSRARPRASLRASRARGVRSPRIRPRRGVQHREPALRAPLRLRRRHRRDRYAPRTPTLAPRARLPDVLFPRPTRAEDPLRVARPSTTRTGLIHTRRETLPPRPLAHVRPFPATQRSFTAARTTRRSSTLSSPSTARRWTGPWSTTISSPTPSAAESRR